MRPKDNFPVGQTSSSLSYAAGQYSITTNSVHPGSNLVANGRHYAPSGSTGPIGHNQVPANGFYNSNNHNINQHNNMQYHQENRRATSSTLSLPPTNNSSTTPVFNGFHYPFSSQQQQQQQQTNAPISPHHVGLPLAAFGANHTSSSVVS